ncbi:MAG: ABC transporter ATP-binding protein, partial [Mobilitalea sp.]
NRVVIIRDGKTSSERILKQSYDKNLSEITGFQEPEEVHEEYAVLDRVGRVQLPREILEEIGLQGNKVKIELIDNRIIITRPEQEQVVNK